MADTIQGAPNNQFGTHWGVDAKREFYHSQLNVVMDALQAASVAGTLARLETQTLRIGSLLIMVSNHGSLLTNAAVDVRKYASTTTMPTTTREQYLEITKPGRQAGSFPARVRRATYIHAIRALTSLTEPAPSPDALVGLRYLRALLAHPKGVDIVDAFARSTSDGVALATDLIGQSSDAIRELEGDLREEPEKVWRLRPGIVAGLRRMGLDHSEGITRFALAWSLTRRNALERAIEVAGSALVVLDLLGGPQGRAVSAVLSVFLAGASTTISFLKDLEQDQAADATAFASPAERLSEGSSKLGTILLGASTLVAALMAKFAGSEVTSKLASGRTRAGKAADELLREEQNLDVRQLLNNGKAADQIGIAERGVGDEVEQAAVTKAARRAEEGTETGTVAARQRGNVRERSTLRKTEQANRQRWDVGEAADAEERAVVGQDSVHSQSSVSRPSQTSVGPRSRGLQGTPPRSVRTVSGQRLPEYAPQPSVPPAYPTKANRSQYVSDVRRLADGYSQRVRQMIKALPVDTVPSIKSLERIDKAIRDDYVALANRLSGLNPGPFARAKRALANEGERTSRVLSDNGTLTLVGRIERGEVEFDAVRFRGPILEEHKLSLIDPRAPKYFLPTEETLAQMRKQAEFVRFYKRWTQVKWIIVDQKSYWRARELWETLADWEKERIDIRYIENMGE